MKGKLFKNRKAVSPVIATVILVSVTIVVAIAVAYWMTGVAGIYTRFEKVEIITSYAEKAVWETDPITGDSILDDPPGLLAGLTGWEIEMDLKNTGSDHATIVTVLVNGRKLGPEEYYFGNSTIGDGVTVNAGKEGSLTIYLACYDDAKAETENNPESGVSVTVTLISANGKEYPDMIPLT